MTVSDLIAMTDGSSVEVSTFIAKGEVIVETEDGFEKVVLFLSPGQAVKLSRALVKAAAEALGVEV